MKAKNFVFGCKPKKKKNVKRIWGKMGRDNNGNKKHYYKVKKIL